MQNPGETRIEQQKEMARRIADLLALLHPEVFPLMRLRLLAKRIRLEQIYPLVSCALKSLLAKNSAATLSLPRPSTALDRRADCLANGGAA
jgi:hypothetical protein